MSREKAGSNQADFSRFWVMLMALVLVLVACGGSGTGSEAGTDTPVPTTNADQQAPPETQAPAEEPTDEPADEPAPEPDAIAITLTIGDETWEFPGAECYFWNAPAGDAGSNWSVSYNTGEISVNVDVTSGTYAFFGVGIENPNPTAIWEAFSPDVEATVNGDEISASGTFTDQVNGGTAEGTLTATCPDWVNAGSRGP